MLPMDELIKLGVAVVAIVLVLLLLRRASAKSRAKTTTARERLGVEEAEEARPRRERKRPRPGEPELPPKKAEEPEEPEAVTDEESKEAYKAGLAKTRGGFVARLGKLFGKKKIDAQTLDELEEVLFTADIGPRAADRIFTSVKSGLSKNDLEDSDKIWAQIKKTSKQILAVD